MFYNILYKPNSIGYRLFLTSRGPSLFERKHHIADVNFTLPAITWLGAPELTVYDIQFLTRCHDMIDPILCTSSQFLRNLNFELDGYSSYSYTWEVKAGQRCAVPKRFDEILTK